MISGRFSVLSAGVQIQNWKGWSCLKTKRWQKMTVPEDDQKNGKNDMTEKTLNQKN